MAKPSNPPPAAAELRNPKHRAVAEAFIRDPARVGWRAYKSVFPGTSEHAAQTSWSRLLRKAEFSGYLDRLKAAATDATVMDLREVLAEQSKIGRANMRDLVHIGVSDNIAADVAALAPEQSAAIQEITVESYSEPGAASADEALEDQPQGGALKRRKRKKAELRVVKRIKLKLHSKASALAELRAHHEPTRHEHTGAGGKPIEHKVELSPLEVARRIAFALERGRRELEKKGSKP
jgi:phage terminase small subunit